MISRERLAKLCQWFKRKSFVICCGIAPVILLSALLVTCDFGCNVIVDGEIIGTAPSREYVHNLIDSINEELAPYLGGSDAITVTPVTTPKLIIGKSFTTGHELGEALKSTCPYLETAYSIKSNDKTVVAFKTEKERQKCYDKFIDNMTKGSTSYEILDEISFKHELVPYGMIKSGDSAMKMLSRKYEFNDKITINADCRLSDVLTAYCITESDFKSLNPKYKEGKQSSVKIKSAIPYIRVVSSQSVTEKTLIKHSIKYEADDTMLQGETKLKNEGKDGEISTKKTTFTVNGKSVYISTDEKTVAEAGTQVLLYGTKEPAKGTASGNIARPVNGVLTSRYGSRGGRQHKGIDIGGTVGSDITAADGGVVSYADWDDSGYGYVVKIDHKNGYSTLYAHCNELYVKKGESVAQGDVIAALGNTGRSTGPHVHFEVINTKDGSTIDPLKFFDVKPIA